MTRYSDIHTFPVVIHPSREGFISWVEKQPAKRRYHWPKSCECAVGTYLIEACGIPNPVKAYSNGYDDFFGPDYHSVCELEPWTYGALLKRLRRGRGW